MDVLLIIPCYNEEKRLQTEVFNDFMNRHTEIKFLFVNDGSSDNTGEILQKLCSSHPDAKLLELPKNSGKAEAVRQGMLYADNFDTPFRFVGFLDADLATPLEELPAMLSYATESSICISGCRFSRLGGRIKRNPIRHFIGRIFATAASLYLDLPVYDTQCGAKFYTFDAIAGVFQKPFVTQWLFDIEILQRLIQIYGKERIIKDCFEYPLHNWEDKSGSKIKICAILLDLVRLIFFKE